MPKIQKVRRFLRRALCQRNRKAPYQRYRGKNNFLKPVLPKQHGLDHAILAVSGNDVCIGDL